METKIYLLALTKKEADNPMNCGYRFAYANKDRWVTDKSGIINDTIVGPSYNRDTTFVVIGNQVYSICRVYVVYDEGSVVYILKPTDIGMDEIDA